MTDGGVNLAQQGTFSFSQYPSTLILLWAPLVDSIYFAKFGRRKTWFVPLQFLMGVLYIGFAFNVENLVQNQNNSAGKKFNLNYFYL